MVIAIQDLFIHFLTRYDFSFPQTRLKSRYHNVRKGIVRKWESAFLENINNIYERHMSLSLNSRFYACSHFPFNPFHCRISQVDFLPC